jgi:carboxyl-terminal processing protease
MNPIRRFFSLAAIAVALLATAVPSSLAQSNPPSQPPTTQPQTGQTARQRTPVERLPFNEETKKRVLDAMTDVIERRAYVPGVDFSKWKEYLSKQEDAIAKADTEEKFAMALNTALRNFGFSHIVLATPRAAEARISRSSVGIGVNIQPHAKGLMVVRTVPDAPAEKAGIKPGDILVEANGKKIRQPGDLAGEEGAKVRIKVEREDGSKEEFTIVRRKFSTARPEELEWHNPDTAVVRIPSFDLGYSQQRVEKLMTEAAKAKNLIVDLRSNGGGAVINMMHFMSLLMPAGTDVGVFVSRSQADQFVRETNGSPTDLKAIAEWSKSKIRTAKGRVPAYKGRIAVLINGATGSASEITAMALRENLKSPIVGTKSAGAVLVSTMATLPGRWQLQYPLTDYVTLKGIRLEGNGIKPDIEQPGAAFLRPGEKDAALEYALALINRVYANSNDQKSND